MNEKFIFKGTFLPDSAPSSTATTHATSLMSDGSHSVRRLQRRRLRRLQRRRLQRQQLSKSRPSAAPDVSSPYAAYDDVVAPTSERAPLAIMHALSLDSVGDQHVQQKPRDREARGNAPGAPGGKNEDYPPAPFLCARERLSGC
jgi:hypothetical protein